MREVRELEGKLQAANQKMERAARSENVSRAGQRGTTSKPKPTQEVIQEEPAQEEPAPKKTGVSRLQQLREATGERIKGRDDSKGRVMARKPEPEKTPEQKEQEKQQRMARRKELAGKAGRALFSRKPYTKPAKEILGRAKQGFEQTLQESTERSRKKFADRREAEQKEKEEWAKTRDRRSLEFQRKEQLIEEKEEKMNRLISHAF